MHTSIPTLPAGDVLVYKFGVRLDKTSVQHANYQIVLARRLYNDIVAFMRQQVQARSVKEIELAGPEAVEIQSEIAALSEQFKAAKSANDESAMSSIAAYRRAEWTRMSAALKEVRAKHKAELKLFLTSIGRTAASATYQLRSTYVQNGLGWGTANAILDNALQAFQSTFKTGQAPQFARGDDKIKDTLTLQFTTAGGVPIDRILAGDHGEFQLGIPHNGYGRRCYGEMRFRLGAAKADTWATGTWQAHRSVPEDAHVAGVSLVRERLGTKYQWNIQLLLKLKSPVRVETSERLPLAVLHLGWSADSSGRRIGAIADAPDAGLAKVLQLPSTIEEELERARMIQAARDAERDAICARLRIEPKDYWETLPEELADEMRAILRLPAQHVAIQRLHRFMRKCSMADCDLFSIPYLEAWRKEDKIHHQSAAGIAKRARNSRRDWYRKLALDQCKRYTSIVVDSVDLKATAIVVSETTGEHSKLTKASRACRVVAALYEYVGALKWAAARCDTAILESNGSTVGICSTCGSEGLQTLEGTRYQQLQCHHCGAVHDRKCNAAAVAYQKLCANAQDYVEQSAAARVDAAASRAEKQRERVLKVAAARRDRTEREALAKVAGFN